MLPSPVTDLKSFVPAKDAELSKKFYADLGFTINWSNDQIAELQIGAFRFLLQTFYVAEHAGNFMMSTAVEDADAWWEYIQRQEFIKKYPGIITSTDIDVRRTQLLRNRVWYRLLTLRIVTMFLKLAFG